MSQTTLAVDELYLIAQQALKNAGVEHNAATETCAALMAAEQAGISSHGFARLPYYLDQLQNGKIKANAEPTLKELGSVVNVDAGSGLAFPAVQYGLTRGITLAQTTGIVAVAIRHSHHFGMAGYYAEQAAHHGLLCMAFSNGPAAMAPWGGSVPIFGTNPIAFASPRRDKAPLVIDLSLSEVARGKIMLASQKKEKIPVGWAMDRDGSPTTDADEALAGSMAPAGGAKGAALALMVELLTAGLTGSNYGFQASSFFSTEGGPPHIAQLLILLNPVFFSPGYLQHAEMLFSAMLQQADVRLPGDRRQATKQKNHKSLTLPAVLIEQLRIRAG